MRGFQKWLVTLLVLFGVGIMVYSGYHILSITHERNVSESTNRQIADNAVTFRSPQTASPGSQTSSPALPEAEETVPAQSAQTESTLPTQTESTLPPEMETTQSAERNSTQPTQTGPILPAETEATQPTESNSSPPTQTGPTLPAETEATPATEPKPTQTEPTVPAETAPLSVDFDYLQDINQDVVAWIYSEDTPINYPVVLSADNSDYLHRLLDGTYNAAGTLFMDFRNSGDFSEENSIIYGHHMNNGSMFASLEMYRTQSYYDEHPVLYLLTPDGDYKLELIAGKTVHADDQIMYSTNLTVEEAQERMENSDFQADVTLDPQDHFVTLSTCAYSFHGARYVVTGVLRPLG